MERDAIIERLRKLRATAESYKTVGNAEAAASYAAKVQELLLKHKLSMSDVDFTEETAADPMTHAYYDPMERDFVPGGRGQKRRTFHIEQLAAAVARAHDCQMILSHNRNGIVYLFLGRSSDVEIVTYMFTVLGRTGFRLAAAAYRKAKADGEDTKGFYVMWHRGYVGAIRKRYDDTRRAIIDAARRAGQGTALVRLDTIKAEIAKYEAQHFDTSKLNGIGSLSMSNLNVAAFEQGTQAGKNVSLAPNAMHGGAAAPGKLGAGQRLLKKGGTG